MILEIAAVARKGMQTLLTVCLSIKTSRDQGAPGPGGDKRVRLAAHQTESLVLYLFARGTAQK